MKKYMIAGIARIAILAATLVGILALSAVAEENATVTGDDLNFRKAPSVKSRVIGKLNRGDRVEARFKTDLTQTIGGKTARWYNVDYSGTSGYLFGGYLKPDEGADIPLESEMGESERLRMIGLLDVHWLNEVLALPEPVRKPKPLKVYSEPDSKSKTIAVIDNPKELVIRERNYDFSSLEAYEKRDGWYLVAFISDGVKKTGWIAPADTSKFYSLPELYAVSLSYLTDDWDGSIWEEPNGEEPGGTAPCEYFTQPNTDINVADTKYVDGELWIKVEILSSTPCELPEPKVVRVGWIRAYSWTGKVNVWFYSRGC
jgi:hypothetical protein